MSISGRLEDVGVAEVMQFIHLGGRTGTLYLELADGARAEIGFHRGRIVAARGNRRPRLGDLLLEQGRIDLKTVQQAVQVQQHEGGIRVLGEVLVSMGAITRDQLRHSVEAHIRDTILEILTWTRGTFRFALNEVRPIEGFERAPGEILPDVDLSTQSVLLEAARLFDERNRDELEPSHDSLDIAGLDLDGDLRAAMREEATGRESNGDETRPSADGRGGLFIPAVHVVSEDEGFVTKLGIALHQAGARLDRRVKTTAGFPVPGEPDPIVIVDLLGGIEPREISEVHHRCPRSAIVAVPDTQGLAEIAFQAGAVGVAARDGDTVVACLRDVAETRRERVARLHPPSEDLSRDKLRRLSEDIRSGILSTSAALVLLKILSDSLERAVLFLVQDDHLAALGGFGFSTGSQRRSIVEVTRGLRIPIDRDHALTRAIAERRSRRIRIGRDELPEELLGPIGAPSNGDGAVFPVMGTDHVILLVYADNGALDEPISEVELLDLAAIQVGVAIENELLRKRLTGSDAEASAVHELKP